MSCQSCKEEQCLEVVNLPCDDGCPDIVNTDCIYHNVDVNTSSKLFNLGIVSGASLNHILKSIDERLSLILTADYGAYNFQDPTANITNNKEFVEYISLRIKKIEDQDKISAESLLEIDKVLCNVLELLDKIIHTGTSSSRLNINTTDKLSDVIKKIVEHLEDLVIPSATQFQNGVTVKFVPSGNKVSSEVILSEMTGNTLRVVEDGLYSSNPSVTSLLKLIKDNPELQNLFNSLVSYPSFKFDIMSDTNRYIEYINNLGEKVTETAKKDVLLKLSDVKTILTIPVSGLTITFKGI